MGWQTNLNYREARLGFFSYKNSKEITYETKFSGKQSAFRVHKHIGNHGY